MSDPVSPSTSTPPPASGSSLPATPTAKLSALDDPTKKYTLIFLVSVGTTLLLTGASGGRLLKRAKATTAPTPTATPSPSAPLAARPPPPPPAGPSAPAPISPNLPPSYFSPQPPQSFPSPKPQHLLKTFRLSPSSPSTLRPTSAGAPSDYFLPNATLLAHSNEFAEELDRADRLHKDGPEQPEAPDDGFNPAVFAAKAFAIATALTVSAFAAGIGGLMYYLGAEDVSTPSGTLHALAQCWTMSWRADGWSVVVVQDYANTRASFATGLGANP